MERIDQDEVNQTPLDPVYLHVRREAIEILVVWAVVLAWSVGYCSLRGYDRDMPLSIVLGIPAWVLWGVVVPWAVATAFTCYFSLVRMKNDPLGEGAPPIEENRGLPSSREGREA